MNKETIAYNLLKEKRGSVPIFLNINDECTKFNPNEIINILILGKDSNLKIDNIISMNPTNFNFIELDSLEVLQQVHLEMLDCYKNSISFFPLSVVIIRNLDIITEKKMLIELLRKGHGAGFMFICAYHSKNLDSGISENFNFKIDEFYAEDNQECNAIFDFMGIIQKIKF